jgi:hypothetical protein
MPKVTRRMRKLRELDLPSVAIEYVSMLESEGYLATAIEESDLPNGGVIGFDSSDAATLAEWNRDNPVRDICLALSVTDSRVWRPQSQTEDPEAEIITVKVRERVKDEDGENVILPNGKVKTKTASRKFAGVSRSRTLSDERGQPVTEEYRDEDGKVKRRVVKANAEQ